MRARVLTGRSVALVLTAVVGLVGCGGGGPSVEDFTAEADAICQEHRGVIDAAASEVLAGGQLPDPEKFGQLVQETIIPETTTQLAQLGDLEPADEVAEEFQAYLDEAEQALETIRQDPTVLTNPANFTEVNEQAAAAGLSDACHIGPG